jgi:ADP-ribose pyrophosphatase
MRREIIKALEELKTVCMEKVDGNRFLSIENYICTLNNGKQIKRERILKNKKDGSAVIIYPVTKEGKIIIAAEPRVFTKRTVGVGFPAGYIEEGEEPVVAAKRELLEETGYTTDYFIEVGSFYQDQGCSAAFNHYFIALYCEEVGEQKLDPSEYIEYFLVDDEELEELLNKGYITGLNSAYLIEKGKKYVRRK